MPHNLKCKSCNQILRVKAEMHLCAIVYSLHPVLIWVRQYLHLYDLLMLPFSCYTHTNEYILIKTSDYRLVFILGESQKYDDINLDIDCIPICVTYWVIFQQLKACIIVWHGTKYWRQSITDLHCSKATKGQRWIVFLLKNKVSSKLICFSFTNST